MRGYSRDGRNVHGSVGKGAMSQGVQVCNPAWLDNAGSAVRGPWGLKALRKCCLLQDGRRDDWEAAAAE